MPIGRTLGLLCDDGWYCITGTCGKRGTYQGNIDSMLRHMWSDHPDDAKNYFLHAELGVITDHMDEMAVVAK